MSALTATSTTWDVAGSKYVVTNVLGAVANTDTLVTGLRQVDFYVAAIEDTGGASAGDALQASFSGGTATFGVAGTLTNVRLTCWGC